MPLPAAVVAALVAGGAGLAQGGLSMFGQRQADRRYNQSQREALELQNKHNIAFWNMQNEYNDPSAQMARLRKAGLNPHLVYGGNPGQVSGTAGQIAPSKAPNTRHENLWKQMNLDRTAAQVMTARNLETQNTKNLADAALTAKKTDNQDLMNWILEKTKEFQVSTAESQAKTAKSGAEIKAIEKEIAKETKQPKITAINDENKFKSDMAKLKSTLAEFGITLKDPLYLRYIFLGADKVKQIFGSEQGTAIMRATGEIIKAIKDNVSFGKNMYQFLNN